MGGRGVASKPHQWFRWNKHNWPEVPGQGDRFKDKDDSASSSSADDGVYQEFEDVSRYSKGERDWYAQYEYDGDGSKQIEFFKNNSNAYEIIESMSSDEREAFLEWARGEFMDGQQWLGWDKMATYHQNLTKVYDKILDKSVLNKGITVTRDTTAEIILGKGNTHGSLDDFINAKGSIITADASMSTGVAKTGLGIGSSSGKQVRLRIQIPAGAKGAGMWIGDKRIHGWGAKQLEFMTNRDSVFQVGDTVYDKKSDMYVVNIKWLGHKKHNYGKKGTKRNWA